MKRWLKRWLYAAGGGQVRGLQPLSRQFGFDRGLPIDRFYIEHFLESRRSLMRGTILEIADNTYSCRYAEPGASFQVLHLTSDNPQATLVGDLCDSSTLPNGTIDCFICTQTLNFIYDFRAAIAGIHHVLKPAGTALVTVAGLCQISRYDMDRWGDYWRFTTLSMQKAFEDQFGVGQVEVDCWGNVLSASAFLQGLAAEELKMDELLHRDRDYQIVITVVAKKC